MRAKNSEVILSNSVFLQKLNKIRLGAPPRVLDLFAGCGGLSLGFHSARYLVAGAVELDPTAAATHARNFFRDQPEATRSLHATPTDISKAEPAHLVSELGLGEVDNAVDVIIGGPPCQAYARVGRAKLREVAAHPHAYLRDPRNNLYLRYIHYVKELKPIAILLENVPDLLNYGGHNVAEEMCEVLEDIGYNCAYTLLNAANYGVPQMRERVFILGYARATGVAVEFPIPTRWVDFPKGYAGTRSVALRTIAPSLFSYDFHFVPTPAASQELAPAVTARDALMDLPTITSHLRGQLRRGTRHFIELAPYQGNGKISEYARLMRTWPGFESSTGVFDHVIRYLPRDYRIFRRMRPGDQYPEAYEHALRIFESVVTRRRKSGKELRPNSSAYELLRKQIVPPYDPGKFPNKWRKMEPDAPARTVMAHIGKDSYTHIHYDSAQARTISVREAARLQSFPDGFIFEGRMNAAFRQIGNAVPPLLARALALQIRNSLNPQK